MPVVFSYRKKRSRARFKPKMPSQHKSPPTASQSLEERLNTIRIEEISDSDGADEETMNRGSVIEGAEGLPAPKYLSSRTRIRDAPATESSCIQDQTELDCLEFLAGNPFDFRLNSFGLPKLQRSKHALFLRQSLETWPPVFAMMDASRMWLFYWGLAGLSALGIDTSEYRERLINTLRPVQNATGGFGGGHGQISHLAATYAALSSVAMEGSEEAYEMIDRRSMWHFLGQMKQPDGGFTMCDGGEEDIRGAYCAIVILSLLNLPLELPPDAPARIKGDETFLTGLPEWISRCQTYEGGIGCAPGNEAHGGYAFCAIGCLCILGEPYETIPKYLDIGSLLHWLSSRQQAVEGGFSGRTNKLVDGCYSHWVGGCWALVEAALRGNPDDAATEATVGRLWHREALVRYTLCCAQGKRGGLRDKPGKNPDSYHSCYNLCGLNNAQYSYRYSPQAARDAGIKGPLAAAFGWIPADDGFGDDEDQDDARVWDVGDMAERMHPVYTIPLGKAEQARRYYEAKLGF